MILQPEGRSYRLFDFLLGDQLAWNIPLFMLLLLIALLYKWLVKNYLHKTIVHRKTFSIFLGLGLLYLAIGSPLTKISELSFSLHMLQMSILYFIIPPLIIYGMPAFKALNRWLLPPQIALVSFAILLFLYHIPIVINLLSAYSAIHNGYVTLLFILSLHFWWPLVAPDPKHRFQGTVKKQYCHYNSLYIMPACLLLIVSAVIGEINNPFLTQITAHLCLPSETNSIQVLPPFFNTSYDQITAGILMIGIHKLSLKLTIHISNDS
ncbi:MAG TPA: hypothetical protein DCO80_01590 [Ornithinibacillus sp.]|nr:hypothetical protein [Ornithinibacillus sp.]